MTLTYIFLENETLNLTAFEQHAETIELFKSRWLKLKLKRHHNSQYHRSAIKILFEEEHFKVT